MAKIHKLKKDSKTIYPATIMQAVFNTETGKTLHYELGEVVNSMVTGGVGWYGIEWDENVANSACTRIGTNGLHRTLPIQNRMRRCLLKDDGTVNYYLDVNNLIMEKPIEILDKLGFSDCIGKGYFEPLK